LVWFVVSGRKANTKKIKTNLSWSMLLLSAPDASAPAPDVGGKHQHLNLAQSLV